MASRFWGNLCTPELVLSKNEVTASQTLLPEFYVLLTVHLDIIFVNNQLDAQFFFIYVYFYSVHVSGSHVLIIRRINCINTSGICHSVWMTVWCADLDETHPNLHTKRSSMQSDIYQVSYCKLILLIMGTWLPETCRE